MFLVSPTKSSSPMFSSESEHISVAPQDLRSLQTAKKYRSGDLNQMMKEYGDREKCLLSNVLVKEFPKTKFGSELQILMLDQCLIDNFENFEKFLPNVSELSILNSNLKEIPENFTKLKNLKLLNLEKNSLTSLPSFFQKWNQIEVLNLSHNNISTIEHLTGKNISVLNLSNCTIRGFPSQISTMVQLESLNLSCNQIGFLPNEFKNLSQLISLNLNNCGLQSFPPSLLELKHLKSLDISNNRILNFQSLEKVDNKLVHLEELLMDNCNLKKKVKFSFVSLKKLSLKDNFLTHAPGWTLDTVCPFSEIDLSNNLIFKVKHISKYTNLRILILKNNKIDNLGDFFDVLEQLVHVDISTNLIGQFPWIRSKSLVSLVLSHNQIKDPKSFEGFGALKNLDLSHNNIQQLPDCKSLSSLRIFNLSYNHLKKLQQNLYDCPELTSLNLASNCFREIDPSIEKMINLKHFDCQLNDIAILPTEITSLKALKRINANYNPCCEDVDKRILNWFQKFEVSHSLKFSEPINFMEGIFIGTYACLKSKSFLDKYAITDVASLETQAPLENVILNISLTFRISNPFSLILRFQIHSLMF
jgi:Leucine-rich repeat (LRR) protein